ncbi:MAG: hypothetical protein COS99_01985 [Candidatus Omnitrophica bacterium CG07_land_8_20_14_0_80_42_15]|uniref:Glycosyltransferase 2-like domain-containing protein n=1 Tax=Candidatus Aquitaenariimonas noxiae TaxID=1974741 RepID=A0A2J0KW80_9BACT|nr:MAG: hypothetical protein COS99_01985 [Candidatus Omnitrophica bacterium CG07_land_8_20_14_0_80_42_15]
MQNSKVKVSVVIPAYNYAKYLHKAIDSALNQDYTGEFEVIVVNDASTDKTDEICNNYGKRIIYLKNNRNLGLASTLNKGIRAAKGEYILTLESDDELLSWAMRWYAKALDAFPFIAMVYGDFIRAYIEMNVEHTHKCMDFDRKLLESRNIIYCSTQMYRKKAFQEAGNYQVDYPADWDLWLRMTERFCALHVPVILQKRTSKKTSFSVNIYNEGSYGRRVGKVMASLRRRKLINSINPVFYYHLKQTGERLRCEKMTQASNQCDFIEKEFQSKKVLVIENSEGYLTAAFNKKGIKGVRVDKENLVKGGCLETGFDLVVLWDVMNFFQDEDLTRAIDKVIKSMPKAIALFMETQEAYGSAYDRFTKPYAWWIEQFSRYYKTVEPMQVRPKLDENNWFYNYGLDKIMFFKKTEV